MSTPSVGDKMIDAPLIDLQGNKRMLSNFTGKHTLVHFWSMTCFICMNAAKELKVLYENYNDKLNLVGINMDTEKGIWEQGTRRDNIVWHNLSDGMGSAGGIGNAYGVFAYPAYVLFNPESIIIDRWMGFKSGRFEEKMRVHLG